MKLKIKILICKHWPQIVFILFIQLETNAAQFNDQACTELNKTTTNCTCEKSNLYYEFICSDEADEVEDTIEFTVYIGDDLHVVCDVVTARDYSLLPNVSIGDYPKVHLRNCPTIGEVPIAEILQRLGITQVTDLEYEITTTDVNIYFKEPHLMDLHNLQVLRLNLPNISQLTGGDHFNHLPNLRELYLKMKNIVDLNSGTFESLKNLLLLDLSINNLTQLPAGTFRNQRKLIYLNLAENQLTHLEKLSFEGATSVSHLDLSFNHIENLNVSDVFQLLPELSKIKLDGNSIRELPANLLKYNKKLKSFSLTRNRVPLKRLPAKLFADLPELGRIHLSCQLEIAPENLFANSSSLTFIDLSKNNLTILPANFLAHQHRLHTLDLSNNNLQTLADNLFQHTYNLLVLKLAHNKLVHVSIKTLKPLFNFKYLYIEDEINSPMHLLDLSHNRIASLDSEHIDCLTDVSKEIRLSHNQIRTVNVSGINFSHKMDDLRLDLSNNPLNCNCRLLDFVQFIQAESGKDCRKKIALETGALLCKEPHALAGKHIENIDPMSLLCSIDCNHSEECNAATSCQYWRRSVDATLVMNCPNVRLTAVPELPSLERLKLHHIELNVENNEIVELEPDMLSYYANVTKLFAAGNNIEKFEPISLPLQMTHLDLSRNRIERLSTGCLSMLNESQSLKWLYLSENLWTCNCEAREMLKFTKINRSKVSDLDDMFCADANHSHRRFLDISVWDICPKEKYVQITFAIVAILSLMMFVSSTFYYKYQLEVKVWLYVHNLCLWRDNKELLDVTKFYDAFVSYADEDEQFIEEKMLPNLEEGPLPRFRLCIGRRDWLGGDIVLENIQRSIKRSHRTIIVLSQSYIKSLWGRTEFRLAHINAMPQKCRRVIVILYEDVGDWSSLDDELQAYLKTNTYVKWNDRQFWNKLRYFLPHHSKNYKPAKKLWRNLYSMTAETLTVSDVEQHITETNEFVENSNAASEDFASGIKKNAKTQLRLASTT